MSLEHLSYICLKIPWRFKMFAGKEVRVLLKGQALENFLELKKRTDKEAQILLRSIQHARDILQNNPQYGDPIAKDLIPDEYKKKYGTTNLFRVELPAFWRMLYTLTNNEEIEIIAFVLDIIDNPTYDKKFGYRKN